MKVYRDYATAIRYTTFVGVNCLLFYTAGPIARFIQGLPYWDRKREQQEAARNRERLWKRWKNERAHKQHSEEWNSTG
ncbi:hypothetical protein Gasu2_61710 [Galdieria sulphuraria]|uniref:Uncharacterized protein n=1 Tax=Galdieria sulphuraria TaxID=130081 RepID=M2XDR2_GALSU|nr:uncharacterized protein Gasu_43050 [Galdieria sulphuraria]EME28137.1 hypothetical protein Gasu_43050 [Galdieria sulphuraria]GJD12061.1 hypothetical protein Gasu2_61710 [Galdieria sulphuraria]|eukprot:XP_005704657.1 hypothetical protein Gasu_43050 [Galdieria sulphuraria]